MVVLNALPKTALAPIFIIWGGAGVKGIVVVAVSISLILTILSAYNYFKNVDYICPNCHTVFKPSLKETFFAKHTPTLRKLTCSSCGHHGFCVEVYRKNKI